MGKWDDALCLQVGEEIRDMLDVFREHLRQAEGCCYLMERQHLPSLDHWVQHLNDIERFNETFFRRHYRMERSSFWNLRDLLAPVDVFFSNSDQEPQALAELQILTMLKYLGTDGTDGSYVKIADHLGCSVGAVSKFLVRTTKAFMEVREGILYWPTEEQRWVLSEKMREEYGFQGCVGMVDGTLIPLEFKPTINGEEYFMRKSNYAVNAMIFVDTGPQICHIKVGWPGSVHDNRVWRNSPPYLDYDGHFSPGQYFLGDSAFSPSDEMVPAFWKPANALLGDQEVFFNTKLAKARIKTEHAIGLLKGWFPWLKHFRVRIKSKNDMAKVVKHVYCAAILHNLLVEEELPDDATMEESTEDGTTEYEQIEFVSDNYRNKSDKEEWKREQVFDFVLNWFDQ